MKHRLTLLTSFSWLLTLAVPCYAKDWHNISPLKTARAEVLQLLGKPQHGRSDGGEYFEVENQTVTIRWTRRDCYGRNSIIDEQSVGPDALVYQITVTPKVPLEKIDSEVPNKPDTASLKEIYRRWLSQDMHCIVGAESGGGYCTIWDGGKGFGYTSSKAGVTATYYFPTDEEGKAWSQTRKPCLQ